MHSNGFVYGCLVSPRLLLPHFSSVALLGSGDKPAKDYVLHFSKIEKTYEDSDGEELAGDNFNLTLAWVKFVKEGQYLVPLYAMRDLVFVKVDHSRLITESDPLFNSAAAGERSRGIDWSTIASMYDGITVDTRKEVKRFEGWDVDSLCLWDRACVKDVIYFKNAGIPWQYF